MNSTAYDEYAQVAEPPRQPDYVKRAVMLCKEGSFQRWLAVRNKYFVWTTVNEKEARNIVCELCGIKSRAELATNDEAAAKFRKLESEFRKSASGVYAA